MKAVFVLSCCLGAALLLQAQSPVDIFDKAPPEIEKALRERAAIFFQAHVDGKFRKAEQVIHKDSLDDFYNSEKTRLLNFEITRIKWSDNFTKAELIADVELDWITSRGVIRVKPPMKSYWMLDDGQWWWYVQHSGKWETPFGEMKSVSKNGTGTGPQAAAAPAPAPIHIPSAQEILNQLSASKEQISLASAAESQDSAEILSQVPGDVRLELQQYSIPGLTVRLDKTILKKGETAHVSFTYVPPDDSAKSPKLVYVQASPLQKVFSFTVVFSPPANPLPGQPKPGALPRLPAR